jgi:hypothetical protein
MNDSPPTLCSTCAELAESSNLKWTRVGGMAVGMHRRPMTWRLRDAYSGGVIQKNAQYSQRLASAARLIHELKEHIMGEDGDYEVQERRDELITKIERYFTQNVGRNGNYSVPGPLLSKLIEITYDYINPHGEHPHGLPPVSQQEALDVAGEAEAILRL